MAYGSPKNEASHEGAARLQLKSGLDPFNGRPRRGTGNLGAALPACTPIGNRASLKRGRGLRARLATDRRTMDTEKQADIWTWIVIGLVFGAVTTALYGPLVWELTRG